MATKNSLRYTCTDALGKSFSKTFQEIDANVTNAHAQALGTAMVGNKEIFATQPVAVVKIEKIATETTEIPTA